MLLALDLDGVVCDLGPGVAARIERRYGVATHPATWRSYDLTHLGLPEPAFRAFLDDTFADPRLYEQAPPCAGAGAALRHLRKAGWSLVGITARSPHLAEVTEAWLAAEGVAMPVHHVAIGTKARVAERLGADAAIEDHAYEADLLAEVCDSWLLDRPYNRHAALARARRLQSWDDAVGRLCQLRLFA